jgi:hypothetical protein
MIIVTNIATDSRSKGRESYFEAFGGNPLRESLGSKSLSIPKTL